MRIGLYSRIIAWLKILLPLAALALLSTLFLLSRQTQDALGPEIGARLGTGADMREEVRGPSYAGVTDRGEMITLTALTARPEGAGRIFAETVNAVITLENGNRIELEAGQASLSEADNEARLENGVHIRSSTGHRLETAGLVASLDAVAGRSLGPVSGQAPEGTLEAGGLTIAPAEDGGTGDAVQLLFTDGVKMIYRPEPERELP